MFTSRASAAYRNGRVVLTLFAPNTRFDLFLTMCGMLYRDVGGVLLGSGAYMVGSSEKDVVRLVRNPHARAPAKIESIEVRCFR